MVNFSRWEAVSVVADMQVSVQRICRQTGSTRAREWDRDRQNQVLE